MSPAAQPTSLEGLPAGVVVPAHLLQGGEEIVLALKPSPWFVLLVSLPSLLTFAALAVAVHLLDEFFPALPERSVLALMAGAGVVRLVVACLQWVARLYVLTNLRVLRVQGVLNVEIFECPLTRVQNTFLSLPMPERLFGLGTILFATAGTGAVEAAWWMIARPKRVHRVVVEYLQRAHHNRQP